MDMMPLRHSGPTAVRRRLKTFAPRCARLAARPLAAQAGANPPDLRAFKLTRARQLVADPKYPSAEILQAVARLLAQCEPGC